jgi:hypothetical protein
MRTWYAVDDDYLRQVCVHELKMVAEKGAWRLAKEHASPVADLAKKI